MAIAFGSINTGLPKDIVQQLMQAERIPIKNMEARKAKVENKKKLVEELTDHLSKMRAEIFKNKSARNFRELKVNTSDSAVGVNVDKNIAEPGNYSLEVQDLAQKSSAMTNGIDDKDDTYLGVGYIQYELSNGKSGEIYIESENSSLEGIAKAINGRSELGMRATVINDGSGSDSPWRLIISLDETGDANKAEFPYIYLVDGEVDLYFDKERAAKDAKVKLDGFDIQLGENKTSELIPGITLDLKKAKPGEEISIEIKEDTEKMSLKIQELVDSINKVLSFILDQNTLDENSDTSSTLGGDSLLTSVESKLRGAIFNPVKTGSGTMTASELGISFQRNGQLLLDSNKFQSKLDGNYKKVAEFFTGTFDFETRAQTLGFIDNLEEAANQLLRMPTGLMHSRKRGLQSNIDRIDNQIANKERMLDRKEESLKKRFARLEETISKIKSQGAGLAALGSAPNTVTQLG